MWISLGNDAEVALVFAQTDPEKRHRGIACFLVPTDHEGFSSQEIHGKLGLRASDTASICARRRRGPRGRAAGRGRRRVQDRDDGARLRPLLGGGRLRRDLRGLRPGLDRLREGAPQFGVPIASFQLVQEMIADMIVRRDAARLLVRRAGILKDQGEPNTLETSIAKLYATESAVECANLAIQVHGGSGYVDDYPVERYLRDARVTTLYEGTSQIQKLIIGREATGINAMTPLRADA